MRMMDVPRGFCADMVCPNYNQKLDLCCNGWGQHEECKVPNHESLIRAWERSQYQPFDQEDDGEIG